MENSGSVIPYKIDLTLSTALAFVWNPHRLGKICSTKLKNEIEFSQFCAKIETLRPNLSLFLKNSDLGR